MSAASGRLNRTSISQMLFNDIDYKASCLPQRRQLFFCPTPTANAMAIKLTLFSFALAISAFAHDHDALSDEDMQLPIDAYGSHFTQIHILIYHPLASFGYTSLSKYAFTLLVVFYSQVYRF